MKKIGIFVLTLAFFIGCGVEKNPPKEVPPNINEIINLAWQKYDAGEFSDAYALFDSAITLDSYDPRGYYGKGWSATQLLKLNEAISSFSFTLILYGIRLEVPVFMERIPEDSTSYWMLDSIIVDSVSQKADTFWHIKVREKPLLALTSVSIKRGTKLVKPEVKDMDDSTVLFLGRMPVTDTLIDTISINYYALNPSLPPPGNDTSVAYAGLVSSYAGNEDFVDAIIAGRALNKFTDSLNFPHYPPIDIKKVNALVAYSAFKMGYMGLCVRTLEEIDPNFDFPDTLNPYDPDNYGIIFEELNKFLGGS